jgi:hypothetical protein
MRTVSDAIKHFGEDEIKGKFLLVRINAKGDYIKHRDQVFQTLSVMCYEVRKNSSQIHLIAVDSNPQGRGIISLGAGTEVIHLINGRKKNNGLDGSTSSWHKRCSN